MSEMTADEHLWVSNQNLCLWWARISIPRARPPFLPPYNSPEFMLMEEGNLEGSNMELYLSATTICTLADTVGHNDWGQ